MAYCIWKKKATLYIEISKANDKQICILVEDNGVGREKSNEYKSKHLLKKKSYGSNISKERILHLNAQYGIETTYEIIDKTDQNGNSLGTKVIMLLPILTNTKN